MVAKRKSDTAAGTGPIEQSQLYKKYQAGLNELPKPQRDILNAAFITLRNLVDEESKYIVEIFPEYTPHDASIHLANLFSLADKILGTKLYGKLEPDELIVLAFGLYSHDWGMAVSKDERDALFAGKSTEKYALLPNEPEAFRKHLEEERRLGRNDDQIFRDYVRGTHGARSGARLRRQLEEVGGTFPEAVAKVAEGHSLDMRDIRDGSLYPTQYSVLTGSVNLGAISTYVRLIDLLDIGSNRTPFALWKFVSPRESKSAKEWKKHRALAPVTTHKLGDLRRVNVTGVTDDPDVYANLEDLRLWVDPQLRDCVTFLGQLENKYGCGLDSGLSWNVEAKGFEPSAARFRFDRTAVLDLLIDEIYEGESHTFLRELLQNSVDAVEARQAILKRAGLNFDGRIDVKVATNESGLSVEWRDNGIGMNEEVVASYLATLGRSWYKSAEFRRAGLESRPVSRFGVGILSCFLVTDSLLIETKREPSYGGEHQGLSVRIPGRDRTFHIRGKEGLEVGTMVQLEIKASVEPAVSSESVTTYIKEIAGFVQHELIVDVGGEKLKIAPVTKDDEEVAGVFRRDANVKIVVDSERAQQDVDENTRVLTVTLGEKSSSHEGFYSASVPKRPEDVYDLEDDLQFGGGPSIDFQEVGLRGEGPMEELFVKGILAEAGENSLLTGSPRQQRLRMGRWPYRLLVNVKDPSLVRPSLGRTRARSIDGDWLSKLRIEIGHGLRECIVDPEGTDEARGLAVGAAITFGGLSASDLTDWYEEPDWPVLALVADAGLIWTKLASVLDRGLLLEAPSDLDEIVGGMQASRNIGMRHWRALNAWRGPMVLAVGSSMGYHSARPCEAAAVGAVPAALQHFGYFASAVRLITSPPGSAAPYAARVWRKDEGIADATLSVNDVLSGWSVGEVRPAPDFLREHISGILPELVEFPPEAAEYAAIGNLFWNVRNAKIAALVEVIFAVDREIKLRGSTKNPLTEILQGKRYSYSAEDRPRRVSNLRCAIGKFDEVVELGRNHGVVFAGDGLTVEDTLPGTVVEGRYDDRLNIIDWLGSGAAVGRNVGSES